MLRLQAQISPPHSIILMLDPDAGVLPETMQVEAIASTTTALAVGTLAEFDGPTRVGISAADDRPTVRDLERRWAGRLETRGRLAVMTVTGEIVLETPAAQSTSVEVWTTDEAEPDLVWFVVE